MSNTEKWVILLPQDAAPGTAVNIQDYVSTTDVPAITNNMYSNSGIGINMEAVVTVTTQTVYELGTSKAVAGGNVATQATITERGFCWGAATRKCWRMSISTTNAARFPSSCRSTTCISISSRSTAR